MASYLLQMLFCSAMLFAYYRLFLYNEQFHKWNRFYLIAAILISVVTPLLNIPVAAEQNNQLFVTWQAALPETYLTTNYNHQNYTTGEMLAVLLLLVSLVMFLHLVTGIVRIMYWYWKHPHDRVVENVCFINTHLKQAPFSFFNWLFWRSDIDTHSPAGKRMLIHEITHIKQLHSVDKMFTAVLLTVFWFNPFFWLIRRELNIIHEFLADKNAVESENGAAFAEMILQAASVQQTTSITPINYFYSSSQLKRRLRMITTSPQPRYSYLRRISSLILMICFALFFSTTVQKVNGQNKQDSLQAKSKSEAALQQAAIHAQQKVMAEQAASKATGQNKQKAASNQSMNKQQELLKAKHDLDAKANHLKAAEIQQNAKETELKAAQAGQESRLNKSAALQVQKQMDQQQEKQPLYLLDGEEISASVMSKIDPSAIQAVNVYKGEKAIEIWGSKGKHGVVEVVTKTGHFVKNGTNTVVGEQPLYYIDGKRVSRQDVDKLDKDKISKIDVLKGKAAIDKWGDEAKNGVVEVTMKAY